MNTRHKTLLGPACGAAICLVALALHAPTRAQLAQSPTPASSERAAYNRPFPSGERYRLARVFYGPSERHELDIAEANALSGPDEKGKSASPATVRFDGWLSGPGPTHAWINGAAHVGGKPAGSITAGTAADEPSAPHDPPMALRPEDSADSVLTPAADSVRFDPGSKQLIIANGRGKEVRLRAGQSEDQEALRPLAAPRESPRPQASEDSVPAPLADPPLMGERP